MAPKTVKGSPTQIPQTPAGRSELVDFVSRDLQTTGKDARLIVDSVTSAILHLLEKHEAVKVPQIGTFRTIPTPERIGRNPKTSEAVTIAPSKRVVFRAAVRMKLAMKERG